MQFAIHAEDESLDIDLEGNLTFNDSDLFSKLMRVLRPSNDVPTFQDVRINVERLEKLDACGLDMLLSAVDDAKRNRRNLSFIRPNGEVEKILRKAATLNRGLIIVS